MGESKRPSCELYEITWKPNLRSANEVTSFRGWRCSCGAVGSGYRFDGEGAVVVEWAQHASAKGSEDTTTIGPIPYEQTGTIWTAEKGSSATVGAE